MSVIGNDPSSGGARGDPIPGSRFVRDYCAACGQPIRVAAIEDEHGTPCEHTCSECKANRHPGAGRPHEHIYDGDPSMWEENNIRALEDWGQ